MSGFVKNHFCSLCEPRKRVHSPSRFIGTGGLASVSENGKLPYGRRFPVPTSRDCRDLQLEALGTFPDVSGPKLRPTLRNSDFSGNFFNTEHGKRFFPKMLHVLHKRLVEHSSTMAVTSKTLQNNDLTLCGGLGKCLQAIEKKVKNQSLSNGAGYSPTLEAICRRGKA